MKLMETLMNCKETFVVEVGSVIATVGGLVQSGILPEIREQIKDDMKKRIAEDKAKKEEEEELQRTIDELKS